MACKAFQLSDLISLPFLSLPVSLYFSELCSQSGLLSFCLLCQTVTLKRGFITNVPFVWNTVLPDLCPTWQQWITALLTRLLLPAHVSSDSWGFPHSSVGKERACNAGDPGLIPGSGRSPGEGTGNPLQYSCLENPMDRGGWHTTVHGVTKVGLNLATKPPPPPVIVTEWMND